MRFRYEIKYVPGREMCTSDCLSRALSESFKEELSRTVETLSIKFRLFTLLFQIKKLEEIR